MFFYLILIVENLKLKDENDSLKDELRCMRCQVDAQQDEIHNYVNQLTKYERNFVAYRVGRLRRRKLLNENASLLVRMNQKSDRLLKVNRILGKKSSSIKSGKFSLCRLV